MFTLNPNAKVFVPRYNMNPNAPVFVPSNFREEPAIIDLRNNKNLETVQYLYTSLTSINLREGKQILNPNAPVFVPKSDREILSKEQ